MRKAYKTLVGKPEGKGREGKGPLGRPRRRWDDNTRMDICEMGREIMDFIHLDQDKGQWRAVVNAVMNITVPQKAENFWTS
jgi:hypothetical protein